MRWSARAAALLLSSALLLGGCASVPSDPAARAEFKANHDPLEPLNRKIFSFNLVVDRLLIKPLAKGYRKLISQPGRQAIRNFLDNLNEPIVVANTLLQGRFKAAGTAGGRFVVNSTAGVLGLVDVARKNRWPKQFGDFGQTLWKWGVSEGPYLILPVLGPSNPRDGIGMGVDIYIDPFRYIAQKQSDATYLTVSREALDGIDQRASSLDALDEIQHEAVDYYASFRSYFRQHRAAQLTSGGAVAPLPPAGFYDDPQR